MKYALLQDGLAYWAVQSPDRPAFVIDDEEMLTFAELARWSDGIAEQLQAMGVVPGDFVGITGTNCLSWVAASFGILKAGGIVSPYNDRFVADEFAYLIGETHPRAIIADAPRADILNTLEGIAPILPIEDLERFKGGAAKGWQATRVESDQLAMVIFTSGTTGRPKGVMISHGNQLAKIYEIKLTDTSLGTDTRALMPFGLHSGPGTMWGYMVTTLSGGALHVTRKFDAQAILKTLVTQKITYIMGMPLLYERVCKLPEFADADLSSITMAMVGGARMAPEITRKWRDKDVVIRQLYRMTEVGGNCIVASEADALVKPDSCGRGSIFARLKVVDADGNDCLPGVQGDVLMRAPGMMVGYLNNPEATAKAFTEDGWLVSGDIGMIDEDGYFWFVDRSKDIIISGGFNLSPSEIESVIMEIDGVVEVCVIAAPDEKFGEVPAACIYAAGPLDHAVVRDHCSRRLAGFKQPRHIVFHAEPLPRMASNKLDKRAVAAGFRAPSPA